MEDEHVANVGWLSELETEVRAALARMDKLGEKARPALQLEYEELAGKIRGWRNSLGNSQLADTLRKALEDDCSHAIERQLQIEIELTELGARSQQVDRLLDRQQILSRLNRLSEVLGSQNPTAGNLELSLHIEKIACSPNGSVVMRTCKLGALAGAVELFAETGARNVESVTEAKVTEQSRPRQSKPRRRGRLRVPDLEDQEDHLTITDFATDPNRFADLGEEWFWTDVFQIPEKKSWPEENGLAVQTRSDELERDTGKKPSLMTLAREFGKSKPTIKSALDFAAGKIAKRKLRGQKGKYTAPIDDQTKEEIVRLFEEDKLEIKEIAGRFIVHRNTVARFLDEYYAGRGEKRPDGRRGSES